MSAIRVVGVVLALLVVPGGAAVSAHPLGNFSISHYTGIRVEPGRVTVRHVIDMAEIPTFQEVQESGLVPETEHASLRHYLSRMSEKLRAGLHLALDGGPLELETGATDVVFPVGAGGLPTMKIGVVYRTKTGALAPGVRHHLQFRDANFEGRAGWKEVVAVAGSGIVFEASSVPATDRSRELAEYPADLLDSPPQDLEARVVFAVEGPPRLAAAGTGDPTTRSLRRDTGPRKAPAPPAVERRDAWRSAPARAESPGGNGSRSATSRSAYTELMTTSSSGFGLVVFALGVAAGLGAIHALEPGHGKTVVAAYLVGSRGTAWHALVLGLVVTISHTAGVYLLGAVTLYASRHVVPERLYPWLGVASGITIAILGLVVGLRRYAARGHHHAVAHAHDGTAHHHPTPGEALSLRELAALGISGGIVPCPAALVVLLSSVALRRVGFGLALIVAFSVGLAAVLITIGVLIVYAGRLMARFQAEDPLITRWLPLASSVVVTLLGLGIALQALTAAGILQVRLG